MKPVSTSSENVEMTRISRRACLQTMAAWPMARIASAGFAEPEKLPVAAVVTVYHRNSHADVIIGKILEGFRQDGGEGPNLKLVSMFTDQVGTNDLGRGLAEKHGFRTASSIDEAITLGTDKVQVAGVLSIGEHGNYPYSADANQKMFPRRRFLDGIADTFRRCGQVVPVFSDKHLAWNWTDARHMHETARELKFPFMAGSSLPVTWRRPAVSLPVGCEIEEAVAVGYGGLESYGFHALEMLQCMVERRRGGESGIASVQAMQGDALVESINTGRCSRELLDAALAKQPSNVPDNWIERLGKQAAIYAIDYRDGLKASVAMLSGVARQFLFAAKLKDRAEPIAVWFELEEDKPYGHFAYLVRAIEHMIHTGEPAYPVERTLLTSGVLDCAMHSIAWQGARIATPHLAVEYQPTDWTFANRPEES
jgi:hypothetical protein